jgi:hypothetical protein
MGYGTSGISMKRRIGFAGDHGSLTACIEPWRDRVRDLSIQMTDVNRRNCTNTGVQTPPAVR